MKAWDFKGSGAASGIYKSEDAGVTGFFSTADSGFPLVKAWANWFSGL
jgi:hypothetical protein